VTDPRFDSVLETALSRVQAAVSSAVDKVSAQLGPLSLSAASNLQRQVLMSAERDLQLKSVQLQNGFAKRFREHLDKSARTASAVADGHTTSADTDWASLSLVDNAEVERGVTADRLAQTLAHECDGELEALQAYVTTLLGDANPERNPLRPQPIAKALLTALADLGSADDVIQTLSQHLGRVLGPELGQCYGQIVADVRGRGVKPQGLSVNKTRATSSVHGGIAPTNPATLGGDLPSSAPHALPTQPGVFPDSFGGRLHGASQPGQINAEAHMRAAQALSEMFGVSMPGVPLDGPAPMGLRPPRAAGGLPAANPDFQNLLRQIAMQAPTPDWSASAPMPGVGGASFENMANAAGAGDASMGFAGPLMAVNLIRAHREELVRASGGAALDQMVIDIVAALFDQVLSDPKVSPEMARQIARLQMPVLRVALGDMGFFNSRKHPVRRFVNRIATLSASFDDYHEGPGRACLDRITSLVNPSWPNLNPSSTRKTSAMRLKMPPWRPCSAARRPICGCSSATCRSSSASCLTSRCPNSCGISWRRSGARCR
jgi:hypothetical protein